MDRIVLGARLGIGQEVFVEGPPLEALRFQGVRIGSIVTLTDLERNDFRGRVLRLSEERASLLIFNAFPSPTESPLEIILLQALPEKERMEWIIQKATELGVSMIRPFKSDRSVSLEERDRPQKKSHRWQHVALKAAQQSRRARVPKVEAYCSFQEVLETCREGLKILLWEQEGDRLKEVIKRYVAAGPGPFSLEEGRMRIYALVGPEGGLTEKEVALARQKGFTPVKLGQRILRTETAAIALVGILQYDLGDLS